MPVAPPVFGRRDPALRRKEYDANRPPSHERGYDRWWRKVRRRYLSLHPLCEDCRERGETVPAQEVHHLTPISDDPSIRLDMGNLRALCKLCHAKRHAGGHP